MRLNSICLLSLFLFADCSNKVYYEKNKIDNLFKDKPSIIKCENALICYKFMYNGDYPFQLTEKTFWGYGKLDKEFAYKSLNASMDDMVKSIKTFERKETLKDFTYTYGFVNNCKDTLYADYNLNKWIIKTNGQSVYYEFDENDNSADTLATRGLKLYDKFFRY